VISELIAGFFFRYLVAPYGGPHGVRRPNLQPAASSHELHTTMQEQGTSGYPTSQRSSPPWNLDLLIPRNTNAAVESRVAASAGSMAVGSLSQTRNARNVRHLSDLLRVVHLAPSPSRQATLFATPCDDRRGYHTSRLSDNGTPGCTRGSIESSFRPNGTRAEEGAAAGCPGC
jgi:hypothetical protein